MMLGMKQEDGFSQLTSFFGQVASSLQPCQLRFYFHRLESSSAHFARLTSTRPTHFVVFGRPTEAQEHRKAAFWALLALIEAAELEGEANALLFISHVARASASVSSLEIRRVSPNSACS